MNFLETVENRHSIRDFSDRPVSHDDLVSIINTAKMAPSWANSQTWKVVVATGDTLEKIRQHHQKAVLQGIRENAEIPTLHRQAMGWQGMKNAGGWIMDIKRFLTKDSKAMAKDSAALFNAPAVAYLLVPRNPSLWETYDLGAFGQTLMLAATNLGIDSIPAMEFVLYPDFLHDILDVDDKYIFAVGIGLGYRKDDALINQFRSKRMDNDKFVSFKD